MKLLQYWCGNEIDNLQIQGNNRQITAQNNNFTSEKFNLLFVVT
jgi:hypothetical protein